MMEKKGLLEIDAQITFSDNLRKNCSLLETEKTKPTLQHLTRPLGVVNTRL